VVGAAGAGGGDESDLLSDVPIISKGAVLEKASTAGRSRKAAMHHSRRIVGV
jgi:hypothetical protein